MHGGKDAQKQWNKKSRQKINLLSRNYFLIAWFSLVYILIIIPGALFHLVINYYAELFGEKNFLKNLATQEGLFRQTLYSWSVIILDVFFSPVTDTALDIVKATYGCVALSTGEEHVNIFKQRRKWILQHSALKSNFFQLKKILDLEKRISSMS